MRPVRAQVPRVPRPRPRGQPGHGPPVLRPDARGLEHDRREAGPPRGARRGLPAAGAGEQGGDGALRLRVVAPPVRQLSSRWTVLQKVVLPALWIPLSAATIVFLFTASAGPGARPRVVAWVFVAMAAASWAVLYRVGICLRTVAIADDALVVGDFGREIRVPLREVEGVTGSLGLRPE